MKQHNLIDRRYFFEVPAGLDRSLFHHEPQVVVGEVCTVAAFRHSVKSITPS